MIGEVRLQYRAVKIGLADRFHGGKISKVSEGEIYDAISKVADLHNKPILLIDGLKPLYIVKPGGIVEEIVVPPLRVGMTDRLAYRIIDLHDPHAARFASRYILNSPIMVR